MMATTIDSDIHQSDVPEKHDDEHIRAISHVQADDSHRHASDTSTDGEHDHHVTDIHHVGEHR